MNYSISRRQLLALLGASTVLPLHRLSAQTSAHNFRIRTITAGVKMTNLDDLNALDGAAAFLNSARSDYLNAGYEVQTLRLSTQPLFEYIQDWQSGDSLAKIKRLDDFARQQKMMLSLGPVNNASQSDEGFSEWMIELISSTTNISCSLIVASAEQKAENKNFKTAARIMKGVAEVSEGGEGNFRFVASAWCPSGTPFFPASYFEEESFSIGLESADLLQTSFLEKTGSKSADEKLKEDMEAALMPVQKQAIKLEKSRGRAYLGIDTSPAPNLDVSIGRAIETLSGVPFGSPTTLASCARITDVLKSLQIRSCGYSGLMLPILEDTTLAKRAAEGRYSVSDLLLYSSVCGTGLDVVPLPGDISEQQLAGLVNDVAALATKYRKPLSARLFPVPGKKAGDIVKFNNPYLTDAMVMKVE